MQKLFYFLAVLVLLLFSCKKASTPAPSPPVISFASFTTSDANNAVLTFNFTDPDGDIGLNQSDTTGVYAPGQVGYYDFYMRYYYYSDSSKTYIPFYFQYSGQPLNSLGDSGIYAYRIPFVTDNIKSKTLDGQIIIYVSGYQAGSTPPYNNFRYEFWMYDRAMHKSNVVTTPSFTTHY